MSRWIPALVLAFGLGIGASAHAEERVDWSQYLESPGARPVPVKNTTATAANAPATSPRGKTAKVTKQKAAKPAKAKRKSTRAGKRS